MSLSHALRRSIGRLLVGVLFFAQFAVAAYACPSVLKAASMAAASPESVVLDWMSQAVPTASADNMSPDCDQIDRDAANLCAEHCHQGQQRADTVSAPTLLAAVVMLSYPLRIAPWHTPSAGLSSARSGANLAPAPPPAHAILHCVLRI